MTIVYYNELVANRNMCTFNVFSNPLPYCWSKVCFVIEEWNFMKFLFVIFTSFSFMLLCNKKFQKEKLHILHSKSFFWSFSFFLVVSSKWNPFRWAAWKQELNGMLCNVDYALKDGWLLFQSSIGKSPSWKLEGARWKWSILMAACG